MLELVLALHRGRELQLSILHRRRIFFPDGAVVFGRVAGVVSQHRLLDLCCILPFFFFGNGDRHDELVDPCHWLPVACMPPGCPIGQLDQPNSSNRLDPLVGVLIAFVIAIRICLCGFPCVDIILGGVAFDLPELLVCSTSLGYRCPCLFPQVPVGLDSPRFPEGIWDLGSNASAEWGGANL